VSNIHHLNTHSLSAADVMAQFEEQTKDMDVKNIIIIWRANDPNNADNMWHDWVANGMRGDMWWLMSWAFRSMQRKWFDPS